MICTHGSPLGPLPEAPGQCPGCHGSQGWVVRRHHGPLQPQGVPTSEAVPPHPHTPFSHGPFDTVSWLYLWPHGSTSGLRSWAWERSMGAVASAGRPGRGRVRADPRQDPSSCLSGGPPFPRPPLPTRAWAGSWPRESVGGTGVGHLASWSWIQGPS